MTQDLLKITKYKKELEMVETMNLKGVFEEASRSDFASEVFFKYTEKEEEKISYIKDYLDKLKKYVAEGRGFYTPFTMRFVVTKETGCVFDGKIINIHKDSVRENTLYVLDTLLELDRVAKIKIIPLKELAQKIDLSKFANSFDENIKQNPENLAVYYNNYWLWCEDIKKVVFTSEFYGPEKILSRRF